jgi:AraC family transcriptional regulator of adaptative response / DNA-3-methyladenine glycosylase II
MNLSWRVCSQARISRDARFDGRFFVGVLTTKVYCRPICPARSPMEKNVRYFPTAAAAAEAGLRPCLRCRPECSPGTPAWIGTPSTVSRGLRLISEAGLEDGGVETLAERLGVGSRHLRRLFLQHLGAPPSAVARTRRLHFAKKLIDETTLPMSDIALASGFGCVRRFNAEIRQAYQRTPTQIRQLARQTGINLENQYVFRLSYRPPLDWQRMLAFLAARAIPGVEVVGRGSYRRTIEAGGDRGWLEVTRDTAEDSVVARVEIGNPRTLYFIVERVRGMFDLNADWSTIAQSMKADPELAWRVEASPGVRVPGCWSGFELAVRAIVGQQVSVKGATTLAGRIAKTFGEKFTASDGLTHLFPKPEKLAAADLTNCGMPKARAETIRALARAVVQGRICFDGRVDSEALLQRMCEIPGIGPWTAHYVAMRALGEPDAFPKGDLGLLRALGSRSARELEQRAEGWRPWRAYAAMYLWSVAESKSPRDKAVVEDEHHRLNQNVSSSAALPL